MNHEEIIAMAREEGLSFVPDTNSPLARIDSAKRQGHQPNLFGEVA